MDPEITIEIRSGNVTFSFKTDRNGSNVKETVKAVREILSSHSSLLGSLGHTVTQKTEDPLAAKVVASEIRLSDLNMPSDVKEKVVNNIRGLTRFDLLLIILHYAQKPLTYRNIMSLSEEVGKPINYDWLNTEFHRKRYEGLVRSDPIPGQKEKAYSLTERGKRSAESEVDAVRKR